MVKVVGDVARDFLAGVNAAEATGADQMKAFLLAGGLGERLRPWTDARPKCLVPINGVPLLAIWLDLCNRSGIDSVLINVSRHAETIDAFLQTGDFPLDVRVIREPQPLGNAGTVLANRDFVHGEDYFFIVYTDNLTNVSLPKLLAFHRTHNGPLTIGLFHTDTPTSSGIVDLDPDGRVRDFQEKPAVPIGSLANAGIYVARQSIFDAIPNDPAVVDFGTHVFSRLSGRLYGQLLEGYLRDIGTPHGLAKGCAEWAHGISSGDRSPALVGQSS